MKSVVKKILKRPTPRLYWKPKNLSRTFLAGIALASLLGLFLVERFKVRVRQPYYEEKMAAAKLASRALIAVKKARLASGPKIDREVDPMRTGLIGRKFTPVTSDTGSLSAKQISVNPDYAGLVVQFLKRAKLAEGDRVAIGMSGSFPALNIAVLAAVETLRLKPMVISSASASQYGANMDRFLWLDMERELLKEGIFKTRSLAASLGGLDDLGAGLSAPGVEMLQEGIRRNHIPFLNAQDAAERFHKRIEIYNEASGGEAIRAYINVGGGIASTGAHIGKKLFKPGLNRHLPLELEGLDSVMVHFAKQEIPVIHLVYVHRLARTWGLTLKPVPVSQYGTSKIFEREEYNLALVIGVLVLLVGGLFLLVRSEAGTSILEAFRSPKK